MHKRLNWMLLMLLIALVAFAGCSDDDDPVTPPKDHFADVAGAATGVLNDAAVTPAVISATDLFNAQEPSNPMYTVVDIRGEDDYNNGHIPGAIRSSLDNLVSDLTDGTIPTDKTIVFACYTGQTAGHAKMAAELLGYPSKSLKFGMSSWNPNVTGPQWSEGEKCKDLLLEPETTGNNGDLEEVENAYPSLDEGLEARVAATLAGGFKKIAYTSDLDNTEDYFVMNYWGEADYLGTGSNGTTGHIPGAFQFTPRASLDMDAMLNKLPIDKPIVVYCWTGQHSSQVTFALNVMGYEAVSMLYGANQLMHSDLNSGGIKWEETMVMNYDLEVTPTK